MVDGWVDGRMVVFWLDRWFMDGWMINGWMMDA